MPFNIAYMVYGSVSYHSVIMYLFILLAEISQINGLL